MKGVKCRSCESFTALDDYCRWCGKPIEARRRHPTIEEMTAKLFDDDYPPHRRRVGASHPVLGDTDREKCAKLRREIAAFMSEHRMSATRFGRLSVNNADLLNRLQDGARIQPVTERRIRKFMQLYHG